MHQASRLLVWIYAFGLPCQNSLLYRLFDYHDYLCSLVACNSSHFSRSHSRWVIILRLYCFTVQIMQRWKHNCQSGVFHFANTVALRNYYWVDCHILCRHIQSIREISVAGSIRSTLPLFLSVLLTNQLTLIVLIPNFYIIFITIIQ